MDIGHAPIGSTAEAAFTPGELAQARAAWEAAAARVSARLPGLRRSGIIADWSDETFDLVANGLGWVVGAAFDALGGDRSNLSEVAAVVYRHGAGRARRQIALSSHLRIAVQTRREMLEQVADEVGDEVPLELKLRVQRALGATYDEILLAHMLGYGEEAAVVNAEQEAMVGFMLRVSEAAFAHGRLHGTIVYANDRFADYFSRTTTEGPAGSRWEDVLPSGCESMLRAARSGKDAWRDVEVVDDFGTPRLVRLSLHPVQDRLQALAIDVGDRVAYERQHAEFVRGLIHDLRAPLTLISGWSRTLNDAGDRLEPGTRQKALETIHRAARQLSTLTDNLLELVVIESGTHTFTSHAVDVAALARSVGDLVGSDVAVEAPDEAITDTDADALARVVTNLVDNALTHGELPVTLRVRDVGDAVVVDVVDQGHADPAVLESAFRSRVESRQGFGIGLRTAWVTADALGGRLELTATEPTTVSVTLPRKGQKV